MNATRSPSVNGGTDAGERAAALPGPGLSLDDVRLLSQTMHEFDLVELEIIRPSGEQLRLRRAAAAAASAPVHIPLAAPVAPPTEAQGRAAPAEGEGLRYVTSPFVGTFYRAPGPEAASFVEPGQRVRKGQTLCIVEAMKLMNELEAEYECVIVECLAQNGRPVEYGERLFSVRPV
jgi:acetyl-CoA carboxylase biotin carboxyl carrier protein